MKIGVSYLMGMDKLIYLKYNMEEFFNLGLEVYFIGNTDAGITKDRFDIIFLDFDQKKSTKYLYEYDTTFSCGPKIVNLTSNMFPEVEYETNSMISTKLEMAPQLVDITNNFNHLKHLKIRINKRWTKSEIEDIQVLKRFINFNDFSETALEIFHAKYNDLFTTSEYIFYTSLVDHYIIGNMNVIFPEGYRPINERFLGRKKEISTYQSEQDFVNSCNQLVQEILDIIDLKQWPEKLVYLLNNFGTVELKKNELLLISGFLNCINNNNNYIFIPTDYLPLVKKSASSYERSLDHWSLKAIELRKETKYINGIINIGEKENIKVYELKKSLSDTLNTSGKNKFTSKEKDDLEIIAEKIDKSIWGTNILEILDLSFNIRTITNEEYRAYTGLKDIYIEDEICVFMPRTFFPKYIYNNKVTIAGKSVSIFSSEIYNTELEQKIKRQDMELL